jgi:MurNAc alpha-1-phosphate uridylyltransferase
MVGLAGRPLVDHALEQCEGIPRKFANTHYLPKTLDLHLQDTDVETIFEPKLLETGGGLRAALPVINRDAVFTMNTDAAWLGPIASTFLAQHWNADRMDALMLTVPQSRAHAYVGQGDFIAQPDGQLERGAGDIYTGLHIIKTRYVEKIERTEFSLNVAWQDLLARGTLYGVNYPGHWCDVGYPDAICIAETLLEA